MKRTVGVAGGVFTLVGYVIGASIYILPGQLAAASGPGVFVAFLLASIPALLASFAAAQIGVVFPVSGASYVAVSRVLSPFWGFILVWTTLVGAAVGMPLLAYGLADYLAYFVPGLNVMWTAVAVVLLLGIINLIGIRASVGVQAVMVVVFVVALLFFGVTGLLNGNYEQMTPLFPLGFGAIVMAAVPAYFSYSGFMVIVEMGEEIKHPSKAIPRILITSFLAVLIVYTIVTLALPSIIPWAALSGVQAPVGAAASRFLPGWLAAAISLSAVLAAATSINGVLLTQTRDVLALARDRIFPKAFAHIGRSSGIPDRAVILMVLLSVAGILLGASITEYAVMTVLAFMVVQILAGVALLRLPKKFPEEFQKATFRLGSAGRLFVAFGLIVISFLFMILGISQSPAPSLVFLGTVVLGYVYYELRKKMLKKYGVIIEEELHRQISESI